MLFWLKKFVSYWLMPLPACVTLMVVGVVLLRRPGSARLGRALLLGGLVLLIVLSNKFVSHALLRPLETRYPAQPEFVATRPVPPALARCRYVYVLGGGNGHSPEVAATSLLSTSALGRIVEAVRILRVLPEAKLLVSGPKDDDGRSSHAVVLARAAQGLGIAPERIVLIDHARDTEDESRAARRIVGDAPVALVTSAWHMPRAMSLCRSAGLDVLACPADFRTHADETFFFGDLLWDSESLGKSTWAIRERLGYLWIWLRGKSGSAGG